MGPCTAPARLCAVGQGCFVPEELASFPSAYKEEAVGSPILLLQSAHCIIKR